MVEQGRKILGKEKKEKFKEREELVPDDQSSKRQVSKVQPLLLKGDLGWVCVLFVRGCQWSGGGG